MAGIGEHLVLDALLLALLLGQAHRGNLGVGVDDEGHVVVVDMAALASQLLHARNAILLSLHRIKLRLMSRCMKLPRFIWEVCPNRKVEGPCSHSGN